MVDDFYEDDEPVEDVRADFDAGEKGVTVPKPTRKSKDFVQRMEKLPVLRIVSTAESRARHITRASE